MSAFRTNRKVLLQLATGAGKTMVFSWIAKDWRDGKVLILVHRQELVEQTVKTLELLGVVGIETIVASKPKVDLNANVYVGMVETTHNRLKRGKLDGIDIGLVVADECHRMDFNKVIDKFTDSKVLGVTATPVLQKKETFFKCRYCGRRTTKKAICCGEEMDEWSRNVTMSRYYDDIVVGCDISTLIEEGRLAQPLTLVEQFGDLSKLKDSNVGADGYTSKSIEEVFNNNSSMFNCLENYKKICIGKKTLIFNSNTKGNKLLYEKFIEAGFDNVKMFDSVNSKDSERESVVTWFKNTPGAVLMNVGCFTTGFDVVDVDCIILNKRTKSLSLYLQMVGRGARISVDYPKYMFTVIDGGGNVDIHQLWESKRNWREIFHGKAKEREKIKKEDILDTKECTNCGAIIMKSESICPFCEAVQEPKQQPPKHYRDAKLVVVSKVPLPNPKHIYEYTKRLGKDKNFAYKIMINKIVDLFSSYAVTKENWARRDENPEIENRLRQIVGYSYFHIMRSDLEGGHRTFDTLCDMTIAKIDKYYEM